MIKTIKSKIISALNRMPYVRTLKKKLDFYEQNLIFQPGHFYSPIINIEEIVGQEDEIFNPNKAIGDIDLNEQGQYLLINKFKEYYSLIDFPVEPTSDYRYYYNNQAYSYSDVIFLFSILMHFRPKRIVEIGCGFSSAALLDINEKHFNGELKITFIEPYADLLKSIARPTDVYELLETRIQNVDLNLFATLDENDILFIDTSHVAKTNSDVLFEIFEILPRLKKGVKIHIHDIFYPFEYPKVWVIDQKRNWNEIYFIRAFLMNNDSYKIIAFNTFLEKNYENWFKENMPLCLENLGGSIWLEKVK